MPYFWTAKVELTKYSDSFEYVDFLATNLAFEDPESLLKSIHYKRRAFWIFTRPKSNTFVEILQNTIGMAGIQTHDQQIVLTITP